MTSRILLDLQACATEGSRGRGIGRYSQHLAEALIETRKDEHFTIALNGLYLEATQNLAARFGPLVGEANVATYSYPEPEGAWRPHVLDQQRAAGEALITHAWIAQKPDILHVSSIFEGNGGLAVVPSLIGMPRSTVVSATAYDLIPLLFKDIYLPESRLQRWYESRIDRLRQCDVLLAISEATRQDLINVLGVDPARVTNISGAVDDKFVPQAISPERQVAIRQKFGIEKPFALYTGGIDHRKNVEGLIRAFSLLTPALRNQHQLAIVCRITEAERNRLLSMARACGLKHDAVVLTGFVSDDDLSELYRMCRLFVFPSIYEGFGLPVLEAMACGAPTIAANASSLPEIVGRDDALFSIARDDDIAAAMARALGDADFRRDLAVTGLERAKLFSWKTSAERARAAWTEALSRRSSRTLVAGDKLPRLALVSPMLPEKSGIAHYVTEMLPYLARHFAIDLFVTEEVDCDRYREMGFATHGWQTLPGCWRDYDAGVVYQFGNSRFHMHMLPLLRLCPGTIVLHDAFLSGLMGFLEFTGRAPSGFLYDMLEYCHGANTVKYAVQHGHERAINRFPASRWVIGHATGVIATSAHAQSLLDSHRLLDHAPCSVVQLQASPHDISAQEREAARSALNIVDGDFLVCSFGYAGITKHSIPLVTAWSKRNDGGGTARLVFVGEADGSHGVALRKQIAELGFEREIEITGFISEAKYGQYLAAADLAIQLRTLSRGEASAAALQALSHGIPLIASRHGSLAELPDSACEHVADPLDLDELALVIDSLQRDPARRTAVGQRGKAWIRDNQAPARIANEMASAILRFNDPAVASSKINLESRLASIGATIVEGERTAWLDGVRSMALHPSGGPAVDSRRARIDAIMEALHGGDRQSIPPSRSWLPRGLSVSAGGVGVRSTCGVLAGNRLRSNGRAGLLFSVPPSAVAEGEYRMRLFGKWLDGTAGHRAILDIVGRSGAETYSTMDLGSDTVAAHIPGVLARVDLKIPVLMIDLEVRLRVEQGVLLEIEHFELVPR